MTVALTEHAKRNAFFLVLVASLGYFVDIYDLLLFSIVRVKSLHDIGVSEADIRLKGVYVINMQMFGLLLGGIVWGIVGDKFGRIKVLFGSILLYSIANFANGLVTNVDAYAVIRLIAGIGLAGELGAGVTLVTETLSKERRGYGTTIIAVVGLFGAVAAAIVGQLDWHIAYFVGSGLGILLLLLRLGTFESGMFKNVLESKVSKGNMLMLFNNPKRFLKYLYCILIGAPLWYVVGVLVTQSPEFAKALGSKENISAGTGILYTYTGISIGGIFAGILAQLTKSRKLAMMVFLLLSLTSVLFYLGAKGITNEQFIWLCSFMGLSVGYWATFVTIAAEQFGTNIRATVTTTVPNFVRGSLIPINAAFNILVLHYRMIKSGYIMMFALTAIALFSLSQLKESFSKNLDYLEEEDLIRQRNDIVTIYLILGILFSAYSLSQAGAIAHGFTLLALLVLIIVNALSYVLLIMWRKIGFYGLLGSAVIAFFLVFYTSGTVTISGFLSIAILFGILQIKKNGVTAWHNLK